MASLPLLLFAFLAAPNDLVATDSKPAAATPFHEYQRRITALLKQESPAKNPRDRATAVAAMCRLHAEIVRDTRYSDSDVLKEYRGRLWSRLTKIKAELKTQLAKTRTDRSDHTALDTLQTLESATPLNIAAADTLAYTLSLSIELQGGPAPLLALGGAPQARGGARGGPDWGPDLVDLIERTINPAFWDVVGGPGTIIYYRPLMCLVVTATSEVHGNVNNLIGNLRK